MYTGGSQAGNVPRFRNEILHVAGLYLPVGEINLQPQPVPRPRLEIDYHRLRGRVSLCYLERAVVSFAGIALVDRTVDVHVLVFRVRNARPGDLDASRFDLGDLESDVEPVSVDLLECKKACLLNSCATLQFVSNES